MEYLERKVSQIELKKIFSKTIDRDVFISEYEYFDSDGNRDFYLNFIDTNIDRDKSQLQDNAIELSMAMNVFRIDYLATISRILHSRRNDWIKLTCIDWLLNFNNQIPDVEFISINNYAKAHSKSELLTVQCILNLLLIQTGSIELSEIKKLLSESRHTAVAYRIVNFFHYNEAGIGLDREELIDSIKRNVTLSDNQKTELITRLSLSRLPE